MTVRMSLEWVSGCPGMRNRTTSFVRIDLYTNCVRFYLGELTHSYASAAQRSVLVLAETRTLEKIFD